MLYSEIFRGKTVDSEVSDLAEQTEAHYEIIHEIKDIGEDENSLFFQAYMYDDVPVMVESFLRAF